MANDGVCILEAIILVIVLVPLSTINAHPLKGCGFDQIYNLGDSISDTGNLVLESPYGAATFGKLPYGMNFINNRPTDCKEKLKTALVLVGEIGGNDYNYAFFEGRTPDEINSLVPEVVNTIKNAIKRVISFGAKHIIVPGNFPIGCIPIYLTGFQTNNSAAYDKHNCLSNLNSFAQNYHNQQLKEAIKELKRENPDVKIVYGDYYKAFHFLLHVASRFGFEMQKACCGTGGDYNFNATRLCGFPGVPVCSNPERYISWDGIHLTQNAYKIMSNWLIKRFVHQLGCFHH
ncbi:hypothetical protein M9H77_01022 [Catharanthus roseus]|uniref:Uncharacterized protein n=1 Tax=Catharanthus roseus TaxID=4058 RepID=A0ACC0C4H8_CATRO|nr:hypothetical protein M9H77_01022 [Catharanthus roseus]